ncbi:glycosyltransferase family 2 protein [Algoriphagus aestuariicola]|uniref:Glycosyltransferase family 2 protein n=1 Tax=Algoriphagus aestuariicola TaxID=1852016 RepID=A0ABS3BR70_9BACT|nr:glycosyltransferase family 2 protein [Algoriphagus aestuariicola]MBN7800189.1 glycosyltransferase family 2 protein [Algoriphagus aestuariicola]
MNHPLVSIIIPVYNKADIVRETLESALAQTYSNTEIVLVNDGSTDGSLDILKTYARDFPEKIQLVTQKNSGVSQATNKGIQVAKGEFIQFLDADDLLFPEKIENQVGLLIGKSSGAIATCEWVTFSDMPEQSQRWSLNVFKDYPDSIDMCLDFFNHSEMMADSSYLVPRDLIEKAGPWNEAITVNQDGEFFLRVLVHAKAVLFEPSGRVFYRKPGQSNVSQQKSYQASQSLLESYRCYERELLKRENSNRVIEALAKNYLRFIYVTHPKYPDLIREAEKEIEKFAFSNPVLIGGPRFQQISKWIGFKNAVRLKRILNS